MRQKIIWEHRQALDEMEEARGKYGTCKQKKQCDNGVNCVTCPAALNYQAKKAVFDEKVAALNELNVQAVNRNNMLIARKKYEREKVRSGKVMEFTGEPIYDREALTPARYKQHRDKDNLKDTDIRLMYGVPKSSFEKWKRDNNLIKKEMKAQKEKVAPAKAATLEVIPEYKQQYEQVKVEYDTLLEKYLKLQKQLETANEENTKVKEELVLTQVELQLSKQGNAGNAEQAEKMAYLETELDGLKEVNIGLQTERDVFKAECNQYKQQIASQAETIEQLQADIATLIEDADNDTTEAIQRQFQRFDQWETMMLERLLQMKKAN